MFLTRILASTKEILSWGNNAPTRYYKKDKKQDPYTVLKGMMKKGVKDTDGEEDEDTPAAKEYAPDELQDGLKQIVQKSRSKFERQEAIPKISDQMFLFQVAMNEKQNDDVRKAAARNLTDQALLEKLAELDFEPVKLPAISNLTNKELIKKYAAEGIKEAIKKITDEDSLTDLLIKFGVSSRYDGDLAPAIQSGRIKKDANLKKILKEKKFKDAGEGKKEIDAELLFAIAKATKDKELLKEIALTKEESDYSDFHYSYRDKPFQGLALVKLGDQELAKKIALNKDYTAKMREVALTVAKDEDLYKKAFESDPTFTDALPHIKDDEFLKKMFVAAKKNKKLQKDHQNPIPKIVKHIKDEDFLKKIVETDPNYSEYALTGIHDQKWLKEHFDLTRSGQSKLGLTDNQFLEQITDEKLLKEEYEDGVKTLTEELSGHAESIKDKRKTRFDYAREDSTSEQRKAAVKNIKDQEWLKKAYKKEKNSEVRNVILKAITDVDLLKDIFKKENRKTEKYQLIDVFADNQELLVELLKEEDDGEVAVGLSSHLDDQDIITKLLWDSRDKDKKYQFSLLNKVEDEAFLKKLALDKETSEDLADQIAYHHIADDEFVLEYFNKTEHRSLHDSASILKIIEITKDSKLLKRIALSSSSGAREAFDKLLKSATPELFTEIAQKAASPDIRKKALPYVTDMKILKKIALEDATLGVQLLPKFKDDTKFLNELLIKARDKKVKLNLVRRIKDQEVLKELAKQSDSELGLLALSNITEEKYLNEILNETKSIAVLKSIISDVKFSLDDLLNFVKNSTFEFLTGYDGIDTLKDIWSRLVAGNKVDTKLIDYLLNKDEKFEYTSAAILRLVSTLIEKKNFDLLKYITLNATKDESSERRPYAKEAFNAVRSPEFAPEVRKKAKLESLRKEALLWFAPDDMKVEDVPDFIEALGETDEPHAISKELIHKVYNLAQDEQEQDILVKFLPERHWNERHKKEGEIEGTPYLKPRTSYQYQKGIIKQHDHNVVEMHQQELLRSLLGLAR